MKSGSNNSRDSKGKEKIPYKNSFQGENYYNRSGMKKFKGDVSNSSISEMWMNQSSKVEMQNSGKNDFRLRKNTIEQNGTKLNSHFQFHSIP